MFQSTFMGGKKIKDHLESRESSEKKNVSHKFSGDSEWHTDLTPPLGSGPHFQSLSPIEIIVSFTMSFLKNPSRYDFRSISNTDFAR